jgi:single-stranded-DNA-specific exonuclease
MAKWIEPPLVQPSAALSRVAGHPLVARILVRRGIEGAGAARAFLDPDAYAPTRSSELPDVTIGASRLRDALDAGEPILVWGDFDVDGQTAAALLASVLTRFGLRVRTYIPHRLREGHGIRLTSLKTQLVGVGVLLTCDTGVTEHESIAFAREQGVAVIVTDHHDLPPALPQAEAVVNPRRLPPNHPLYELPGVGVAYKLMQEFCRLTGQPVERVDEELDLVALGIVADVATQTGDTRYLLQRGMRRLRQTGRTGLRALMNVAQINADFLTTDHIGFALGPRLNALGRLGDANLGVELLTTGDTTRAMILANQLEGLNGRRRLLTQQVRAAAQEQLALDPSLLDYEALVLSGPQWHPGVIGIVAGQLAELYGRPAVVISERDDGLGHGSGRSVTGVNIHAAITAVGELLAQYGGHPGAAGLSLPVDRIAEFRRAFSKAVGRLWDRAAAPGLVIDAELSWNEPSLELVQALDALAPFGEGNPPVVLASRRLEVTGATVFGRDRAHRRLNIKNSEGITREVIWWRGAEHPTPAGVLDLAYVLKASDYSGTPNLQIEYVDARTVAIPSAVEILPTLEIVDQRSAPEPAKVLKRLRAAGALAVWAEGYPKGESPGVRRDRLSPAPTLVVWTAPPGPREFQATLERVSPQRIYLFAVPNVNIEPGGFLLQLVGLVRYALRRRAGVADVEELAAASGQRIETVREGIRLLSARGDVRIIEETDMIFLLAPGDRLGGPDLDLIQTRLHALLQETAAYRVFFARTNAEQLKQHVPQLKMSS